MDFRASSTEFSSYIAARLFYCAFYGGGSKEVHLIFLRTQFTTSRPRARNWNAMASMVNTSQLDT
jgi:hypothetical protein